MKIQTKDPGQSEPDQSAPEPDQPDPDQPGEEESGCPWCGKTHTGTFGVIVGWFHVFLAKTSEFFGRIVDWFQSISAKS